MKPLSKLLILVFALITVMFSADPHELIHAVYIWPDGYNADGATFFSYDLYQAETHVNTEDTVACYIEDHTASFDCIVWHSEMGNTPDWQGGDTIVVFGSWDSVYARDPSGYGDNANHTGFYWIYSDTLDATVDPQYWSPNDTLRPLPQPLAVQLGGPSGNIEISIENPAQTPSGTGTYDILGYWLWADTTTGSAGTPNCYNKDIGFFPVSGGPDSFTVCVDPVSNYENGQNVYWAYYLVARPDTGGISCPGYSSYYLSANSNPLVIIGIEETTLRLTPNALRLLEVYPNPFSNLINISFSIGQSEKGIELKIYDAAGCLVKDFSCPMPDAQRPTRISWDSKNNKGQQCKPGVYFCRLCTNKHQVVTKLIKVR